MDPQSRPAETSVLHSEAEGNVAVMAGDLRQGRAPTRRFHVPSAVRGSAARIDAATARELVANEPLLVDVRRKAESDGSSCEKSRPPNARLSVLGILATRGIGALPPRARAANRITRLVRASGVLETRSDETGFGEAA